MKIVVAEDQPDLALLIRDALQGAGHLVSVAGDGEEARRLAGSEQPDLLITDVRLPKLDGLALFRLVHDTVPRPKVILMTAFATVPDAVAALREGAYDYMTKPFDVDELLLRVARLAADLALEAELEAARAALGRRRADSSPFIGMSPPMQTLAARIEMLSRSQAPVVITGESGTGKEMVARALHEGGPRRGKAFVAVNCAAFPETLIESELFGYERGAFTGAVAQRDGRFKAADGGTLLLDEVAEIPLSAQAKLLRVLQDGVIEPLGSNDSIRVDVRVVSATHRNLKERVAQGKFREDLYYRISVLDIHIAPLRERRADLPLLVEYFLQKFARPGQPARVISGPAWDLLASHPFPGNVRELSHAIEHAVVLSPGREIGIEHLPSALRWPWQPQAAAAIAMPPLAHAAERFERDYVVRALGRCEGRKQETASLLGISRKTLWERMRTFGIRDEI